MKKFSILFLQVIVVLVGVIALIILIRFPLTEGRAQNLDLFHIYFDPFILYGYASSIAFFVALYKAFRVLVNIGQNRLFTPDSVRMLKSIKSCAILTAILIAGAGIYIRIFHEQGDDPAGFLGLSMIMTFAAIAVAVAVAVLERILQKAVDMKYENDLTI